MEDITIYKRVSFLDQLKTSTGVGDGWYFTETVNVTNNVHLGAYSLVELPVKFGTVGGSFYCANNDLTSLKGAPSSCASYFDCSYNELTSLAGAPSIIGSNFNCRRNKLTSLLGIHKIIKQIYGELYIRSISGGIGLILIEGLIGIDADQPAFKIIERYLGQGKKGLLRCQEELIDAGYEEFAKL